MFLLVNGIKPIASDGEARYPPVNASDEESSSPLLVSGIKSLDLTEKHLRYPQSTRLTKRHLPVVVSGIKPIDSDGEASSLSPVNAFDDESSSCSGRGIKPIVSTIKRLRYPYYNLSMALIFAIAERGRNHTRFGRGILWIQTQMFFSVFNSTSLSPLDVSTSTSFSCANDCDICHSLVGQQCHRYPFIKSIRISPRVRPILNRSRSQLKMTAQSSAHVGLLDIFSSHPPNFQPCDHDQQRSIATPARANLTTAAHDADKSSATVRGLRASKAFSSALILSENLPQTAPMVARSHQRPRPADNRRHILDALRRFKGVAKLINPIISTKINHIRTCAGIYCL